MTYTLLWILCEGAPCKVRKQTTKWTAEELDLMRHQLGTLERPPVYADIRQLQRMMPSLKKRSMAQIKTRAWILLSKK